MSIGYFQEDYCKGVDIQALILTDWSEYTYKYGIWSVYLEASRSATLQLGPNIFELGGVHKQRRQLVGEEGSKLAMNSTY